MSTSAIQLRSRFRERFRAVTDHAVTVLAILATILVIVPLAVIFAELIYKGVSSLNWDFFTKVPAAEGETGGGMANAIVGSAVLLGLASLIGIPIGIGSGVYLAEFGRGTKLANAVRFTADVLNGVPSIVMGVTAYALIVAPQIPLPAIAIPHNLFGSLLVRPFVWLLFHFLGLFGHFSAFPGGVALGIMMIPTVCRSTEEMLLMVPHAVREAALGLGVPNWRSVLSITVKTASPGIITGCMLAFARVAGETAPLLFTALGNQYWSISLYQPIAALPLQIYIYSGSPYEDQRRMAWAGALVLIVLIVLAVSLVRYVTSRGVLKGNS
jgi:phosphate transport system permease protein